MSRRLALVMLSILSFSSCAGLGVKLETATAAVDGGDLSALVDGCGRQVQDGLMLCRKTEGDASKDSISFIGPAALCAGSGPCVFFKVYKPDGSVALGDSIPRGQTRKAVAWSDLTGSPTFDVGGRGFWIFTIDTNFTDDHGVERTTHAEGLIYLRVLRKDYQSLHDVKDDPNFVWTWLENGVPVKMTTGSRIFVGGAK